MFTVRWVRTALSELASLWVQSESAERAAITAATREIDRQLQHNPDLCGESRSKGQRILFVGPLGITFRVNRQRSEVRVLHVWLI